jgi:YVTN family beta-propeller protein
MSAEHGVPEHGVPEHGAPLRWTRRRGTIVVSAATVTAVAFAGTLALTGTFDTTHSPAAVKAPITAGWTSHATLTSALKAIAASAGSDPSYYAYVAASTGDEIIEVNVAKAAIVGEISADTADGVALTPNGATAYIAETGQYYVLADDIATKAQTKIEVGAYPEDVAVAPSGKVVYATVTGGDTGPGGSDAVAVIDPATNKVTGDIKVGPAPRQVVFSPDGSTAYVTTETGIYEISTATSRVVRVIPDFASGGGPQGITVSPNGATLYVTNPDAGTVLAIDAANGKITGSAAAGAEPEAVAVTPNGNTLYVADMNSDSVSVLSAATLQTTGTISVGRLPMSVTVSPDGSQVWVGNGFTGSVSIIATANNSIVATVGGGPGTSTLDAAITDIAFAPAP